MEPAPLPVKIFTEKAAAVSVVVAETRTIEEALDYAIDICEKKPACELLASGCASPLSGPASDLCLEKQEKIVAAPALDEESFAYLTGLCRDRGIACLRSGLRDHLAGIDVGLTMADFGVADTGTVVIDSRSEEVRLATMISEVFVAVLPKSKIRPDTYSLESELGARFENGPDFTAFITGASRTADIERVLALGVHGPLEMHVLIWEDQ